MRAGTPVYPVRQHAPDTSPEAAFAARKYWKGQRLAAFDHMLEIAIVHLNHDLAADQYRRLSCAVSQEKRRRMERLVFFEDRQRTLMGDVLARLLIHRQGNMKFNKIGFTYNAYGRPFIDENPCGLDFNLSHAGRFVVCAVSDAQVGIDIEIIRELDLGIAEHFFAQDETRYILNAPESGRTNRFFHIWTMKEAYVKYKCRGLSIPLCSFSVLRAGPRSLLQCVFQDEQAVCHVCSGQKPTAVEHMDLDELLRQVAAVGGL